MSELPNKSVAFVAETDFQVIQEMSTIEVINISIISYALKIIMLDKLIFFIKMELRVH